VSENANQRRRVQHSNAAGAVPKKDQRRDLKGKLHFAGTMSMPSDLTTAYDASRDHGHGFRFSVDPVFTAGMLRTLADEIERGNAEPRKVYTVMRARRDEYTDTVLSVQYIERRRA